MKKLLFLLSFVLLFSSCEKTKINPNPSQTITCGVDPLPTYHSTRFWKDDVKYGVKLLFHWIIENGTWSYEISSSTGWKKKYWCEGWAGICWGSGIACNSGNSLDLNVWESSDCYICELIPQVLQYSQNGYLYISRDIENLPFCFPAGNYEISQHEGKSYIFVPK